MPPGAGFEIGLGRGGVGGITGWRVVDCMMLDEVAKQCNSGWIFSNAEKLESFFFSILYDNKVMLDMKTYEI